MRVVRVVVMLVTLMAAMVSIHLPTVAADEDVPRSFAACVLQGGRVRQIHDDLSCRLVTAYTMRTYLSGTTTCGEEVQYEIWGEVRYGAVTFLFDPARVVELPEIRDDNVEGATQPIPCLDDPEP